MKIAIASDDRENISGHFGRAKGFSVFEIENGKAKSEEYRENIGRHSGSCHSCDHEVMINNIKDCKYVISFGMGQRIYDDLVKNGISAVVTDEQNVNDALNKFLKNELESNLKKLH